jgi:hypothetical protein
MKTILLPGFLIIMILFSVLKTNAQSGTNAAGIEATGSSGNVSASFGQVFTNTISTGTFYSVEGVQQPYEISVITSEEELPDAAENISVYPNPFPDFITLKVEPDGVNQFKYTLNDLQGKRLLKGDDVSGETLLEAGALPTGTYILTVFRNNQLVKSFKIVKF